MSTETRALIDIDVNDMKASADYVGDTPALVFERSDGTTVRIVGPLPDLGGFVGDLDSLVGEMS